MCIYYLQIHTQDVNTYRCVKTDFTCKEDILEFLVWGPG